MNRIRHSRLWKLGQYLCLNILCAHVSWRMRWFNSVRLKDLQGPSRFSNLLAVYSAIGCTQRDFYIAL